MSDTFRKIQTLTLVLSHDGRGDRNLSIDGRGDTNLSIRLSYSNGRGDYEHGSHITIRPQGIGTSQFDGRGDKSAPAQFDYHIQMGTEY